MAVFYTTNIFSILETTPRGIHRKLDGPVLVIFFNKRVLTYCSSAIVGPKVAEAHL